ncbi:MAG: PqqD family protein [Bacteroidota bacterium]
MSIAIQSTSVFEIAQGVMSTGLDEEVVLLDVDSGRYFALNELGAFVWNLLDGHRSVQAVHAAIQEAYEVDAETSRPDLHALLRDLQRRSLIRLVDAAPSDAAPSDSSAEDASADA